MKRLRVVWLVLAAAVSFAWLWTSRYEYIACDDGYCEVANRYTGNIGIIPTKLKRANLHADHPGAGLDSLLKEIHP